MVNMFMKVESCGNDKICSIDNPDFVENILGQVIYDNPEYFKGIRYSTKVSALIWSKHQKDNYFNFGRKSYFWEFSKNLTQEQQNIIKQKFSENQISVYFYN